MRSILIVALGSLVSLVASIALIQVSEDWLQPSPIAGDPTLYGEIADAMLSGRLPYIDVTVEHLPLLLVPILAIGLLASTTSLTFAALWPLGVIAALLVAVTIAGRITIVSNYQLRVAVAMLPMIPLILYRLEAFVVVLALASIAAFSAERIRSGVAWTFAGSLAKGWPIVLLAVPFRRGSARIALITLGATVILLGAIATLPGFQEGRAFSGIHAETLVGNALLLVRHARDADLGLIGAAGATYVTAPRLAVAVNAIPGIVIGIVAIRAIFDTTNLGRLIRIAGLGVVAIIFLSPLFSAQFTFWLVPFVPLLTRSGRSLYAVTAFASMLVAALWNPSSTWWALEVLVRNALFVATAALWVREVTHRESGSARLAREDVP